MKTRQKKKNASHEIEVQSRSEMITRSLSHLNRSIRQFSDGLQTRMSALQERLLVEPLESAAWVVSQRVRKVQNRVFDFIDEQISRIDDARHKKLDHQTALERFDSEGGAMLPTSTSESESGGEAAREATASRKSAEVSSTPRSPRPTLEPSFQH